LDADGHYVQPSEQVRKDLGLWIPKKRLEQKLTGLREVLANPERQQVGYLALAQETNQLDVFRPAGVRPAIRAALLEDTNTTALREVIVTKMVDDAGDGAVVGAIVLGFPVADLVPNPNNANGSNQITSPLQSGLLLEDHLYANLSL